MELLLCCVVHRWPFIICISLAPFWWGNCIKCTKTKNYRKKTSSVINFRSRQCQDDGYQTGCYLYLYLYLLVDLLKCHDYNIRFDVLCSLINTIVLVKSTSINQFIVTLKPLIWRVGFCWEFINTLYKLIKLYMIRVYDHNRIISVRIIMKLMCTLSPETISSLLLCCNFTISLFFLVKNL